MVSKRLGLWTRNRLDRADDCQDSLVWFWGWTIHGSRVPRVVMIQGLITTINLPPCSLIYHPVSPADLQYFLVVDTAVILQAALGMLDKPKYVLAKEINLQTLWRCPKQKFSFRFYWTFMKLNWKFSDEWCNKRDIHFRKYFALTFVFMVLK